MKRIAACLFVTLLVNGPAVAADLAPEHWQPVARLIGIWSGRSNAWGARESHEFPSGNELLEVFVATPGHPWRVYSRTQLRRISR